MINLRFSRENNTLRVELKAPEGIDHERSHAMRFAVWALEQARELAPGVADTASPYPQAQQASATIFFAPSDGDVIGEDGWDDSEEEHFPFEASAEDYQVDPKTFSLRFDANGAHNSIGGLTGPAIVLALEVYSLLEEAINAVQCPADVSPDQMRTLHQELEGVSS